MIKLTKLRLINWHYFTNTTVNIENITFLTGANGTGKSTVIDAMQIVLLGDTTGRNFNKAANEKTGRTLTGYLRGVTGETRDGQIVALRPGRFTSYIALQFHDTKKNSDFTLGIVFDCFSGGNDERHFFYLGSAFPENNFTNKDLLDSATPRPLTYKEFFKYVNENYTSKNSQFFDSNEQYRQALKVIFGNLPDKYFNLFKKSVSFVPISDISKFITEFVCDVEHRVDIVPMQKNIEQYRLLEAESQRIQEKIASLKEIHEAYENLHKISTDMATFNYIHARANYELSKRQLTDFQQKIDEHLQKLDYLTRQLSLLDEQIKELNSEKQDYITKKASSSGFNLANQLSQKKEGFEKQIAALKLSTQNIYRELQNYSENLCHQAVDFLTAFKNVNIDRLDLDDRDKDELTEFSDFANDIYEEFSELSKACQEQSVDPLSLEHYQKEMDSYKSKGNAIYTKLESKLYQISLKKNEYAVQLKSVKSGTKPFGPRYKQVVDDLKNSLASRHPDAYVKKFCDLVDVNDPNWSNAIEACLGGNRFNVFVNPSYYNEAQSILKDLINTYDFYGVNIVDSERVIAFIQKHPAMEGSCATLIDTQDEAAGAYADYLLGTTMKCSSFEEARDSGHGLCADCTGYRNFATWYLKKVPNLFLGTTVSQVSAEGIHDEFVKLDEQVSILSSLLDKINSLSTLPVMSSNEARTYRDDLNQSENIPALEENVRRLGEQMKEGTLSDVKELDDKIKKIDEDIIDLNRQKEEFISEKGEHTSEIRRIKNEVIPAKEMAVKAGEQTLSTFDPKDVESTFAPRYDELQKAMDISQITEEANRLFSRAQSRQKNLRDNLLKVRSAYVTKYNLSYDPADESTNEVFDKELDSLSNVLLPQYTQKIANAHANAIKEFKDDFIFKLRSLITTVQSQIKELNDALADVRFGRDRYRFTVEPNKDYIDYYNMMMDPLLLSAGDAEDVFLEKYKELMNQLFSLISDSQDQTTQNKETILANIEKFTDYRTYLNFDLLVKRGTDENAIESSLARTFRSQSGGETQTPFYISILASFAQLYRVGQDSDTLRLVIFDEAFSKMDGVRIKEAVSLLRSFGLQGVISTPAEKLRDLAKLVDEALVAIHDEKHRMSYLDLYEDKRRVIPEIKADSVIQTDEKEGEKKVEEVEKEAEVVEEDLKKKDENNQ